MIVASVPKTVTGMLSCRHQQYYAYLVHPALCLLLALVRLVTTVAVLVVGSGTTDRVILVAVALVVAIAIALRVLEEWAACGALAKTPEFRVRSPGDDSRKYF